MEKSTISMAIFNSKLLVYQRVMGIVWPKSRKMALSRNASIDHWKFLSWHFQTATSEIPHQDDTKGTKPHPHVCCLNSPVPVRERIDHHEHFSTFTLVSSQHCHAGRFPWGYPWGYPQFWSMWLSDFPWTQPAVGGPTCRWKPSFYTKAHHLSLAFFLISLERSAVRSQKILGCCGFFESIWKMPCLSPPINKAIYFHHGWSWLPSGKLT